MAIGAPRAHADTISTFNVSGTADNLTLFSLGSCAANTTCSFSGTLTIDVTTGTVTGADITFPGLSAFDTISSSSSFSSTSWMLALGNGTFSDSLEFDFSTAPTGGSLVGFTGSTSGGGSVERATVVGETLYSIDSLTMTLQSSVTTAAPEPGTLVLLLFGLVALVLVKKRLARGTQPVT